MKFEDRLDYSAIIDRPPLRLPGDARVVVWLVVNAEVWNSTGPMPRTILPAPGGKPLVPDLPNWAWHEYGMRVGFWRILSALHRTGVRATLSLNGTVCERYPRIIEAALAADWDFIGHGMVQKPMPMVEDQAAVILNTLDAINGLIGARPRGWLGPGLAETYETPDLLRANGVEYVCDWVLDDQPCTLRTAHGPLATLPFSVELNDLPMFTVQHQSSNILEQRARDHFETIYRESEQSARFMSIVAHPFVTGAAHRIGYFEKICAWLSAQPGVVFWTGDQIFDWYQSAGRS